MKNYFDLKGQVAVVTGASTGLGLQMAIRVLIWYCLHAE